MLSWSKETRAKNSESSTSEEEILRRARPTVTTTTTQRRGKTQGRGAEGPPRVTASSEGEPGRQAGRGSGGDGGSDTASYGGVVDAGRRGEAWRVVGVFGGVGDECKALGRNDGFAEHAEARVRDERDAKSFESTSCAAVGPLECLATERDDEAHVRTLDLVFDEASQVDEVGPRRVRTPDRDEVDGRLFSRHRPAERAPRCAQGLGREAAAPQRLVLHDVSRFGSVSDEVEERRRRRGREGRGEVLQVVHRRRDALEAVHDRHVLRRRRADGVPEQTPQGVQL
mmetsp:Transcript_11589/g.34689  ORF Transcript_11589/g.34689 Transcript_11589/m.34689 type:complete len:284 (-) Transcript_11589:8-859(-)